MDKVDRAFLKKHHFCRTGEPGKFSRKIHESMFLEYDIGLGFMDLVRFLWIPKHHKDRVHITLPNKVDDQKKFLTLVNALLPQ